MDNARRYEDLRRIELMRAVSDMFRWRLRAAPLSLGVATLVAIFDTVVWRRFALILAVILVASVSLWQYRRDKRGETREADLPINIFAITVVQLAIIGVTGGLESPLFPAVFVMTLLMTTFLHGRWLAASVALQIGAVAAFSGAAVLQLVPPVPMLPEGSAPSLRITLVRGAVALTIMGGSVVVGRRTRAAFEAIAQAAIRARDEALASYADETRTVTTMAGEIAHELKNPLATVKGLAQLVAKDLEGKPAERMGVLRREVDRMADILENFLNFSRPLTPLAQAETDLDAICRDLALLHEGAARERGVRVEALAEGEVRVRCDARKIKQILVKLLQNAIAATPAGGVIRVRARDAGAGRVEVTIADEGPGLAPAIAAQAFEPGVTTKPGGSGLGLTISRGLARQHGGDLRLDSSPAGCTAVLELPRAGAPREAAS
jgi:signal transduction histidine kinase